MLKARKFGKGFFSFFGGGGGVVNLLVQGFFDHSRPDELP